MKRYVQSQSQLYTLISYHNHLSFNTSLCFQFTSITTTFKISPLVFHRHIKLNIVMLFNKSASVNQPAHIRIKTYQTRIHSQTSIASRNPKPPTKQLSTTRSDKTFATRSQLIPIESKCMHDSYISAYVCTVIAGETRPIVRENGGKWWCRRGGKWRW